MLIRPKIIFIGNYNRPDYVRLLEASKDYCEFYFLFYTSPREETNSYYQQYGRAIYWSEFKSAQQLLKDISPEKVIFLYIESYNHVALNLACREVEIPTYMLEHGLRADYITGFDPEYSPQKKAGTLLRMKEGLKSLTMLRSKIRSRLFLHNSLKLLSRENAEFLKEFIDIRKKFNFLETSRRVSFDKRTPDCYISFSPGIFRIHQEAEGLPVNKKVKFIGVPYFDDFLNIREEKPIKAILFIDQPLAEQGILGWTQQYKNRFAALLVEICANLGYQLLVKPHPTQDLTVWQTLSDTNDIKLLNDAEIREYATHLRIVTGFYSTYLMPFAALPHTTLITFECHPKSSDLLVSKPYVASGVACAISDLKELGDVIIDIEKVHIRQLANKASFVKEWLFLFDGKSGERLRYILLNSNT